MPNSSSVEIMRVTKGVPAKIGSVNLVSPVKSDLPKEILKEMLAAIEGGRIEMATGGTDKHDAFWDGRVELTWPENKREFIQAFCESYEDPEGFLTVGE